MIAASTSPPVGYLWEPFSLLHRPGICAARFPYWFPYICAENGSRFAAPIGDMLRYRYRPGAELRSLRTPKDAGRMARDWTRFARYRRGNAAPLMKDPIAVFSAEWLCDTFDMDVVVLVRHPASFAYSLKRNGWDHPFDHFLKQPLLMRDVLGPFEAELREFAAAPRPVLDQAILLWKIIHSAVARYRDRRPDWLYLRLEDVASDPLASFGKLYARLGLAFDEPARAAIAEHSEPSNPAEVRGPSSIRRDSAASIVTWRTRLTKEEIHRVRSGVDHISGAFYSDAEW
jgi:hypothetical protein